MKQIFKATAAIIGIVAAHYSYDVWTYDIALDCSVID